MCVVGFVVIYKREFQCTVNVTTFLHERRAHIFPVRLMHEHFHAMDVADISIHLHWVFCSRTEDVASDGWIIVFFMLFVVQVWPTRSQ